MNMTVETKTYSLPPVDKAEVLRYSGCAAETEDVSALLETSVSLICEKISPAVCFCTLPFSADGDLCSLGTIRFRSADLARHLSGISRVALFAATVGIEPDRLIIRYGRLVPSRGVMLSAVADERIEALCDMFCRDIGAKSPRFSPGYGDLPLEIQKDIFALLNCSKNVGLTLNGSLLMSPSKSVTAIVGIE